MHFKKIINQDSFYIQGLRSFKDTLPKNIKKVLNKKGYIYSDILNKWNYLVGNDISKISFPKSFRPKNINSSGTLVIKVQRGNEIKIEYNKNQIIEKINSYFGYNVINQIKLESFEINTKQHKNSNLPISNISKEKFINKINQIKNDKIKKSLLNLTTNFKK